MSKYQSKLDELLEGARESFEFAEKIYTKEEIEKILHGKSEAELYEIIAKNWNDLIVSEKVDPNMLRRLHENSKDNYTEPEQNLFSGYSDEPKKTEPEQDLFSGFSNFLSATSTTLSQGFKDSWSFLESETKKSASSAKKVADSSISKVQEFFNLSVQSIWPFTNTQSEEKELEKFEQPFEQPIQPASWSYSEESNKDISTLPSMPPTRHPPDNKNQQPTSKKSRGGTNLDKANKNQQPVHQIKQYKEKLKELKEDPTYQVHSWFKKEIAIVKQKIANNKYNYKYVKDLQKDLASLTTDQVDFENQKNRVKVNSWYPSTKIIGTGSDRQKVRTLRYELENKYERTSNREYANNIEKKIATYEMLLDRESDKRPSPSPQNPYAIAFFATSKDSHVTQHALYQK